MSARTGSGQEETKEDEDDGEDEELTEEQQLKIQKLEENKIKWRDLARSRTENLDNYIEKLTNDKKM